jgi:hypothetical protein
MLEVSFEGIGRVIQKGVGHFEGGASSPNISPKHLTFALYRESKDEEGNFSPDPRQPLSHEGAFQVEIVGDSKGYRELARYFLSLAELDSAVDPGFHEHYDGIMNEDCRTRLDFVIRKKIAK